MINQQIAAGIEAVSRQTGIKAEFIELVELLYNAKHSMSNQKGCTLFQWLTLPDKAGIVRSGMVHVITRKGESDRSFVSVDISEAIRETILKGFPVERQILPD